MGRIGKLGLLLVLGAACGPARADIYKFTDEQGVAHYSNVPNDPRYRVYTRIANSTHYAAWGESRLSGSWRTRAVPFEPLISRSAAGNDLKPALLRAVIVVESAFNARATSPAGAKGLMQLLPSTARRFGVTDPFDAAQNVDAGARYLRQLLTRYHDNLELALAAYNAGEDAVDRYGGRIPPYRETLEYVPAVMKWYRQFQGGTAGS